MPLVLLLNGQETSFDVSLGTVSALIDHLGFTPDRIAVEVNGTIIPRARWKETRMQERDKVELVQFVGGGTFRKERRS